MSEKQTMVLKVQQSLESDDGVKRLLLYDEDKHFMHQEEDPGNIEEICKYLGLRPKAYFEAEVDIKTREIKLIKEVTVNNW